MHNFGQFQFWRGGRVEPSDHVLNVSLHDKQNLKELLM